MALMQLSHQSTQRRLGQCISRIYHHSQGYSLTDFKRHCFHEVSQLVPLGQCYWLIEDSNGNSYIQALPTNHTQNVSEILSDCQLRKVQAIPEDGKARALDNELFEHLCSPYCLAMKQPQSLLSHRLVISTKEQDTVFDSQQLTQLEMIMPHLLAATQLKTLQRYRQKSKDERIALAICDHAGQIFEMNEQFESVMMRQTPDWNRTKLPFNVSAKRAINVDSSCVLSWEPTLGFIALELMCFNVELSHLSNKEKQICFLLKKLYSNQKVAETLAISQKTVENHLSNIYRKTGLSSRSAVIASLNSH